NKTKEWKRGRMISSKTDCHLPQHFNLSRFTRKPRLRRSKPFEFWSHPNSQPPANQRFTPPPPRLPCLGQFSPPPPPATMPAHARAHSTGKSDTSPDFLLVRGGGGFGAIVAVSFLVNCSPPCGLTARVGTSHHKAISVPNVFAVRTSDFEFHSSFEF